ncbi:7-cyano-7-deazaguanine synthase QueC [Candidatus Nitrosarchaeum limnium]|jgi:7-cyano-7-deazaguanine synthase|uniref:7-cyano-7-deazaguanine synthase n=1 Tax=Candidatus Nitrosarchaeum limnium BG20 TaxID=859192 RepID=S2EQ12_9ARCH|nr:7-cyano-7-deazaguanine synthase QueC [Candidatus Nitrosarchaeum limnium]EPA06517.1 protein ExsB [Candidatus Nitrosarchaeum limnium BG20]
MKSVLIFSGGLDSTTLLYKLINEGHEVYPLTFLYGQKHCKESESAKEITNILKINHKIIDITALQSVLDSALTNPSISIPTVPSGSQFYETLKTTVVPNRNAIFLAIAAGYAQSIKADNIFFAAHYSDRGMYPDCRSEFISAFEKMTKLSLDNSNASVSSPFAKINKSGVVKIGDSLNVPFQLTWSCYEGKDRHCGRCSACRERKNAFVEASVYDPTDYIE